MKTTSRLSHVAHSIDSGSGTLPVADHTEQIQYACARPGSSVVATIAVKPDAAASDVLATQIMTARPASRNAVMDQSSFDMAYWSQRAGKGFSFVGRMKRSEMRGLSWMDGTPRIALRSIR